MCAGLEEPQESLTEEALSWPWSESDMTEEGSERDYTSGFEGEGRRAMGQGNARSIYKHLELLEAGKGKEMDSPQNLF